MGIIVIYLKDKFVVVILIALGLSIASTSVADEKDVCQRYIKSQKSYFEKLFGFYKNPESLPAHDSYMMLRNIDINSCQKKSTLSHLDVFLGRHTGRIGILLPLTGPKRDIGLHIQAAIRSYYGNDPEKIQSSVTIVDTRGLPQGFHQGLAQLVFEDKVSMIIGGAIKAEAKLLRLWSYKLQTTTLILQNRPYGIRSSPHTFYISPDQRQLIKTLTSYMRSRSLKSIAILHPDKKKKEFVSLLESYAKKMDIEVKKVYQYEENNFTSLDNIVKDLFRLEDPERQTELEELLKLREEEAVNTGESIEAIAAKPIFLPPIVEVDAIFLADHFKTLRHLVGVLKYYKVPRIPLLGTHQWRAPELLQPAEPYLNGSVFVDYVGGYSLLPHKLRVSKKESDFLTEPTEAHALDLWMIGRHGIDVADRALSYLPRDRRQIYRIIEKIPSRSGDRFFQSKQVFNEQHVSFWPTFLFTVSGNSLYQLFQQPAESIKSIAKPFGR